jgi:membrane protein implicated in regulation of membrane protease activity
MFVIVALVLLIALPHPWNVAGFAAGLVCFAGEVAFWHRTVRRHRTVVGAQTLIGRQATVISPCRPTGQVRVSGTIWAARCEAGADAGDTVKVVDRDRLTLVVER